MKRVALLAGLVMLASPALASDIDYGIQSEAMKKMLAQPGGAAKIPTGIDVPGPAFYELRNGQVKHIGDIYSTRDAKTFWEYQDKYRSSGGEGGSQ
jgi:hypothetical protein